MIGDGSIYVRIRETGTGFYFVPQFRIGQNRTEINKLLLNNIHIFLSELNIPSRVSTGQSRMMEINVSGKKALTDLMQQLELYQNMFY